MRAQQAGSRGLARALAHRRRARRLIRRDALGAHVPTRDEPRAARPPPVASHGVHRLDRGLRTGRVGVLALCHGRARVEGRHQGLAAAVSLSVPSPKPLSEGSVKDNR